MYNCRQTQFLILGPTTNGYGTENGDGVTDNIQKFYCKNNGVLFENSLIQVIHITCIKKYAVCSFFPFTF